jgi:hypothetical protein
MIVILTILAIVGFGQDSIPAEAYATYQVVTVSDGVVPFETKIEALQGNLPSLTPRTIGTSISRAHLQLATGYPICDGCPQEHQKDRSRHPP